MDQLTKEDLSELAQTQGECLLSLYMPTVRAGREVQQNAIRFKNLIREAQQAVEESEAETDSLRGQLESLQNRESDDEFWQHQSDGLVMFLDGYQVREWQLPIEVEPMCVRSQRFHIRPLCQFLQNDGRFYVLAVSQNEVRFFVGSKTHLVEKHPEGLPDDLRSALNIDEYRSSLRMHSTSQGGQEAMFHGHGGSDLDVKKQDEIKRYFQHINKALDSYFATEHAPLVFAGVEYLFPIFREACKYRSLVQEAVTGNPDDHSPEELHQNSWPLVEPLFEAERLQALEQYSSARIYRKASSDLDVVLKAAEQGQVDTLLVVEGEYVWTSDSEAHSQKVETHDTDRLNSAVVATLLNSGKVYSLNPGLLKGDSPVAAVFRYPIPVESTD